MEVYADKREGKMELMSLLKDMSPSKTDSGNFTLGKVNHYSFLEIGSLDPVGCCTSRPLLGILYLLIDCLSNGLFWDACQAILKVTLQKHFEAIVTSEGDELVEAINKIRKITEEGRERVEEHIEESLLLSQFILHNTIAVQE